MEVLYNNLYTHFVFTTKDRVTVIEEEHRDRIEKYISGIVNNHGCKMYSIYANSEHVHFLVSRDPAIKTSPFTIRNKPLQKNMIIF